MQKLFQKLRHSPDFCEPLSFNTLERMIRLNKIKFNSRTIYYPLDADVGYGMRRQSVRSLANWR